MLKPVMNRSSVLACLADCPADNHARQLALFLYGTLYSIIKIKPLRIRILFVLPLFFIFGCQSTFNMKSENKNFEKADQIFQDNFSKNGNAFLYSLGTIGPKYIWTHTDSNKIDLTIIDLSGKVQSKQINGQEDWTALAETKFEDLGCPYVLDGDVLKIKFRNDKGKIYDQSLIHDFECLNQQSQEVINRTVEEMRFLKIK